jgi:hypothetical protein
MNSSKRISSIRHGRIAAALLAFVCALIVAGPLWLPAIGRALTVADVQARPPASPSVLIIPALAGDESLRRVLLARIGSPPAARETSS